MRVQRIPIVLPLDEYKQLEELAISHERDPWQQARWMIRRALRESTPDTDRPAGRERLEAQGDR